MHWEPFTNTHLLVQQEPGDPTSIRVQDCPKLRPLDMGQGPGELQLWAPWRYLVHPSTGASALTSCHWEHHKEADLLPQPLHASSRTSHW